MQGKGILVKGNNLLLWLHTKQANILVADTFSTLKTQKHDFASL